MADAASDGRPGAAVVPRRGRWRLRLARAEARSGTGRVSGEGGFLLTVALVLAVECLLFWPFLRLAFPLDEEWAMTDASVHGGVAAWFTRGFADFFVAYPEWDHPGTDLLRPLGNALYTLVYRLGGGARTLLLLLYAGHALAVGLVWRYGRRGLGLGRGAAGLAAGLAALSPALLSIPPGYRVAPALQYPVYGLEVWCAGLMLGAFFCLVAGRLWGYGLFAVLALLAKESALPLPLAALCCTGLWWQAGPGAGGRNARTAAWLAAPWLVWLFLRVVVFEPSGFNAVMVESRGLAPLAKRVLRATLVWPTGMFRVTPAELVGHLRQGVAGWPAAGGELLGLLFNGLFWLSALTLIGVVMLRARLWQRGRWRAFTRDPAVVLLVLAASNLGFVLVIGGQELRYGYLYTLTAPMALVALALRPGVRGWRLVLAALAVAYAGMAVAGLHDIRRNLYASAQASHGQMHRAGAQLVRLLRWLPAGTQRVYLVNDWTVGFSQTESFRRVARVGVPVVRVNDVTDTDHEPCTPTQARQGFTRLGRSADGTRVEVEMVPPSCYDLWFHTVNPDFHIPVDAQGLARRGNLVYRLPEMHVQPGGLLGGQGAQDPGRHLLVSAPFEADAAWVVFDFATQRYVLVPATALPLVLPAPTP